MKLRTNLSDEPEFVVFHYGAYDAQALARLSRRYGGNPTLLNRLASACVNVLALIYGRIYIPVHSTDLKSIAGCLDFKWSDETASGIQSLVWRNRWETSREQTHKQQLLRYNLEDCAALEIVTKTIAAICGSDELFGGTLPKSTLCANNG
jgi:predicted RecB family nuclease